jgi:glycosyltransferase involved in cell wall biosynthesis
MKCVIQIPCWNEERTIADAIRSLPTEIEGIDSVEVIVVDDGSEDTTVAEAKRAGATEVVSLPRHMGLAYTFSKGVETAIKRGADILVNTDADLQYPSEMIPDLIQPILANDADIAMGDRLSKKPRPFSPVKLFLERLGTKVIRFFSGAGTRDAASGFRALNREAMRSMIIHDEFSYTLESLFLAGAKKLRVTNITIPINKPTRGSRLFKNVPQYILRSIITMTRIYLMYHPLKFFVSIGLVFLVLAALLGLRFLYFFLMGGGSGHVQSLILLAVLAAGGFQCIILGLLADIVAANRRLLEHIRLRQLERDGK